jgi:hypothetical protein
MRCRMHAAFGKPLILVLISILAIALVYSSISASGILATFPLKGAGPPPQSAGCYPWCGVPDPDREISHTHPKKSAASGAPDDESGSPTTGQSILPDVLQQQQPPPADQGAAAPRIAEPPAIEDDESQPQAVQEKLPLPTCPEGQELDEGSGLCVLEQPEVAEEEPEITQEEPEQQQSSEEGDSSDDNSNGNNDGDNNNN